MRLAQDGVVFAAPACERRRQLPRGRKGLERLDPRRAAVALGPVAERHEVAVEGDALGERVRARAHFLRPVLAAVGLVTVAVSLRDLRHEVL